MVLDKTGLPTATLVIILSIFISTFTFYSVNATQDFWTRKTPIPQSEWARAGVVDGKIFVIGRSSNYEYNLNDSWHKKEPIPTPRDDFGLAVYQKKIYIIDGNLEASGYSNAVEVYDPATDSWETKEPIPEIKSPTRWANVVDNKIHIILDEIHYIYNIDTDSWLTNGTLMPNQHSYGNVMETVFDNKIYIFSRSDTQIYDPRNDTWTFGTAMPTESHYTSVCCATTGVLAPPRIYFFGGITSIYSVIDTTLIYDPQNDTWTSGTAMPTARGSAACAIVNDRIYVIGGYVGSLDHRTGVNQRYTPIGYIPEFPSWIVLPFFVLVTLIMIFVRNKIQRKDLE